MQAENPHSTPEATVPPGIGRGVLVGLDGSPLAERVLPHAVAMARAFQSDLCLLRVIDRTEPSGRPVEAVSWRLLHAEADRYLRGHVERLAGRGLEVRHEIAGGDAAREIVDYAERGDFGLLVLGSHGEGGASPFALSGTAHKVIGRVGRSVLLVRSLRPEQPADEEAPIYRRIVVPVDGSLRAEWALFLAAAIARSQGAELVLLAVAHVPEMFRRPPLEPRAQRLVDELAALDRRWAEEYVGQAVNRLAAPGLVLRRRITSSTRIRHEIDAQLQDEDADLVVVSAHGSAGGARWPFGSMSSHLIYNGTTPVLVLQDQRSGAFEHASSERQRDDSRSPRREE